MDENKFAHSKTPYERPNLPYRCGRAALWQTPCHQGPHIDHSCGGTSDCTPLLKGDRWECRRPDSAGGPCGDGPSPHGKCSISRPPCSPQQTLHAFRGRLAFLGIVIIIAFVGTSQAFENVGSELFNLSDDRPLSKAHIKFTEKKGCPACHAAHGKGPAEWVKALFTKTDLSTRCVDCHTFQGPSFKAHNTNFEKYSYSQDTQCHMCHRVHEGGEKNAGILTSKQCNTCHKTQFASFAEGHPEFPEKYPYLKRNTINFNHVSHLNKHFENPRFAEKGPVACTGCHMVNSAGRDVRPAGFEVICAQCHGKQIVKKELNLIRLPELNKNRIDRKAVLQTCDLPQEKAQEEEEFLSVSVMPVTGISAYLLNLQDDDPEEYDEPLQELLVAMTEEGTAPLANLINEHTSESVTNKLLAGLNPELIKQAACAWALNLEYEPAVQAAYGGWYADLLDVRYTPFGHADPVAKSWIEFALAAASNEDDREKRERALAMRDQILSPKKGVGSCIKCHAVTAGKTAEGKDQLFVEWKIKGPREGPYVYYSHKNHIDVLGTGESCVKCHVTDPEADYRSSFETFDPTKFASNFKAIKRELCVQCHSENQISQECQVCHIYHLKPGIREKMSADKTPAQNTDI